MSVEPSPPAHQSPILKRARPISSSPSSGSTKSRISVKLGALFGRVVDWATEHRTKPSRPIGENRAHKAIERARELKAKMHGLQTGLNEGTSLLSLTDEELKILDTSVRDVGEEAKSIIKSFGAQRKYRMIINPFSAMSETIRQSIGRCAYVSSFEGSSLCCPAFREMGSTELEPKRSLLQLRMAKE